MNQTLESILKIIIPRFIRKRIWSILYYSRTTIARKRLKWAGRTLIWLDWATLESLQAKYPYPSKYGYDPSTLKKRGEERAGEILDLIPLEAHAVKNFLELGAADGMISCALQHEGKITTAVDIGGKFDERAIEAGVTCLQMDAHALQFEDESFDFIFSYNAFEHFASPDKVLDEAIRVAKKGGYIYLDFGPLYMSPFGLHIYKCVSVPYCQFLFPYELLEEFINVKGLKQIAPKNLSRWTVEAYRALWDKCSHSLTKIFYEEKKVLLYLDLVIKYPSCFKSKTECFDNLIVSNIKALFKKVGSNPDGTVA